MNTQFNRLRQGRSYINHLVTYYKIETLRGEIPHRMVFVAMSKEDMDNFMRDVDNLGCEASLGRNRKEILESKTQEKRKNYKEDMDQSHKKQQNNNK